MRVSLLISGLILRRFWARQVVNGGISNLLGEVVNGARPSQPLNRELRIFQFQQIVDLDGAQQHDVP